MKKRPGAGKRASPRRRGHRKAQPPLDVFVPAKPAAAKVVPTRRPAQGRIAPPALDVFVPVKKKRPPNYMEERAAVLGSGNLNHPWACEPADDRTMAMLASLAGTTVRDLQYRRYPYDAACPERVPVTRARCWRCPFWARHPELTPFDGTPITLDPAPAA